jgi:chaperonin GroEL (HSP60 family)
LDFVLCDPRTTHVRLAIELDDRSHDSAGRKRRDVFVNEALAAAKIPLLRIQAAARYDPNSVAEAVESRLGAKK